MNQATATYQPDANGDPVWVSEDEEPGDGPDWGDDDVDGLPNWLEDYYGTDRYNPDSDYDGATDGEEIFLMGTDPLNWDTDGNGYSDFDDLYFSVHGYYPGEEPPPEEPEDPEDPGPEDPPLAISTTEVPSISESGPYSFTFTAEGGAGSYTWSLLSGALPGDLSLSAEGTLSGDGGNAYEGEYTFEVGVEDGDSSNASQAFTLTVWWPDPGEPGDPDDPDDPGEDPNADNDGDGIPNGIEWELGSDADQWDSMTPGVSDWFYWYFSHLGPHATDTDADGDGLGEILESALGTSDETWDTFGNFYGDRLQYYEIVLAPNAPEIDSDGDGLYDLLELTLGMNPNHPDSDGDGLSDSEEYLNIEFSSPWQWDTDGDGLHDGLELQIGTDARNVDTDGDHLTDYEEYHNEIYGGAFDPTMWSTAGDGVPDYFKADLTDSDGGGIPDRLEIFWGLNPYNAADEQGDIDADGVSNIDEYMTGYDIWGGWRDTLDWDEDGMTNVYELFFGLDPNDPTDGADDPDGDFLTNSEESMFFTNPWMAFTLVDFDTEGWTPFIPVLDENGDPVVDAENNQVYRHPANDYEMYFGVDFAAATAHLARDDGPVPGREYDDDWDGDGLTNYQEIYETGTNPREFDSEPPGELELTPSGGDLGSVEPGGGVSVSFGVTGGDGSYSWSASGPGWLSMDSFGNLSGTVPFEESPGSVSVDVSVSDGNGQTASGQFEIQVLEDPSGSCECMGASCHCSEVGQCFETCGGSGGGGGTAQPQAQPQAEPDPPTGCLCTDQGCGCSDVAPSCGGNGGCVEGPPPQGCGCGGGICDQICGNSPQINGQNPCGENGSCEDTYTPCSSCGCNLESCAKDSEAEAPPCQCWCTCGCNEDPSSLQKCGARGPDSKCQSGSGAAPYPCGATSGIEIRTETIADQPANRGRERIGIGEEVKLEVVYPTDAQVTWELKDESQGQLILPIGYQPNSIMFIASDQEDEVEIEATLTNYQNEKKVVKFEVITPKTITFEKIPPPQGFHYDPSGITVQPEVGQGGFLMEFHAKWYFGPDDVCFYNVQGGETAAAPVLTKWFTLDSWSAGQNHNEWIGGPPEGHGNLTKTVVKDKGTECEVPDHIRGGAWQPPTFDQQDPNKRGGRFEWNIQWKYRIKDKPGNGTPFAPAVQWLELIPGNQVNGFSAKGGKANVPVP